MRTNKSRDEAPLSTLLALERTIQQRRAEAGSGTSQGFWMECPGEMDDMIMPQKLT